MTSILQDLCLALVRSVNYRQAFGTDDDIAVFIEQKGGNTLLKIGTDFQGKMTHSGVGIGLKYFEQVHQKRMIKMVRN